MYGGLDANPAIFSMAKRGRKPGPRGPYKSDVEDPELLGGGGIRLRQYRLMRNLNDRFTIALAALQEAPLDEFVSNAARAPVPRRVGAFSRLSGSFSPLIDTDK